MIRTKKNIKILFKYFIAPLLAVWLFYSLYQQIRSQPDLHKSLDLIKNAPIGAQAWKFWTVILFIFFNWGLEAKKWQLLLRPIQILSFFTALKSVLTGIAFSINTPNRIGEYGGRILYVEEGKRIKAISLSIAGSISQLILTLFMGALGIVYLLVFQLEGNETIMGLSYFWIETLLFGTITIFLLLLLFFFRLSWLVQLIDKIPRMKKYAGYIDVLEKFHPKLLLSLLWLSFFRYLVFVFQYLLLLKVFEVNLSWIAGFANMSILFLVMAIVPSFAIADLGIRGKFSTELLSIYSTNTVGIIGATFGIWLLNLFIPALMGSILILGTKILKEK